MPDIDRAGFVPSETCQCGNTYKWPWDGTYSICLFCRDELVVIDGKPMVRRAGFWRDVALDLSRILPRGKAELQWAVRRAMAADGLNAQAAGETMGAAERTEIQWSGKPESEVWDASDGVREH